MKDPVATLQGQLLAFAVHMETNEALPRESTGRLAQLLRQAIDEMARLERVGRMCGEQADTWAAKYRDTKEALTAERAARTQAEQERDDWREKHRLQGEAHLVETRQMLAEIDRLEAALFTKEPS